MFTESELFDKSFWVFFKLLSFFFVLSATNLSVWSLNAGLLGVGAGTIGTTLLGPGSSVGTTDQTMTAFGASAPAELGTKASDLSSQTQSSEKSKASSDSENPVDPTAKKDKKIGQDVLPALSDFQKYVWMATGVRLPVFGSNLFGQGVSTFAPVEDVPVAPDYLIGPGDELVLITWGQLEGHAQLVVDRNGLVDIPHVGTVSVAGVSYGHLTEVIKQAIGKDYRNFDLQVTMGHLRSIHVYVVGQARQPGAYTLSSLSTLVNALFVSGGPSSAGSMRNIELRRSGGVISRFDVYDFLVHGNKSHDVRLQDGDVLYIPSVGPLVALVNGVRTPAIFEVKGQEPLQDMVAFAGGFATTTSSQPVQILRLKQDSATREAQLWPMSQALPERVHDGDVIGFASFSSRISNAVSLTGHVASPYRMAWHDGMKVSDLIPNKEMLITDAFWNASNQLMGSVRNRVQATENVAENSINWDYAVIERLNPQTLATDLIPFILHKAVIDHDPSQDLVLQPGDVVSVFAQNTILTPAAKRPRIVTVEGEIVHSGVYQALPGETLRQLLVRVGGLAPDAYLYGAVFSRESARALQQRRLQDYVAKTRMDISRTYGLAQAKALTPDESASLAQEESRQLAELQILSKQKSDGRVVLSIPAEANSVHDLPDLSLENGDHLYVPARPSTVGIFGEVYNSNSTYLYDAKKEVGDYLKNSGGLLDTADASHVYLMRMDGSMLGKQNSRIFWGLNRFNSLHLMPGDAIVVPAKSDNTSSVKKFIDWSQVIFNMGVGVGTLKASGVL